MFYLFSHPPNGGCGSINHSVFSLALGLPLQHATVSEAGALCHQPASQRQSLAVMAHSLGSRLVFDALQPDLHPDLALLLQTAVSNSELEVYMLAN